MSPANSKGKPRKSRIKNARIKRQGSREEPSLVFQIFRGPDGLWRWQLVSLSLRRKFIIVVMGESANGFTRRDNAVGAALALHARLSASKRAPMVEYLTPQPTVYQDPIFNLA